MAHPDAFASWPDGLEASPVSRETVERKLAVPVNPPLTISLSRGGVEYRSIAVPAGVDVHFIRLDPAG